MDFNYYDILEVEMDCNKQEIKKNVGGLGQHYGKKGKCEYKDLSITLIERVS